MRDAAMIVVTGANGLLGRGIIENLLCRVAPGQIVANVRDPSKASDLERRGIAVRAGDFADENALRAVFRGAGQVLIVSADKLGDEALRLHRSAIGAAQHEDVGRLLYTSHMGARDRLAFSSRRPARRHRG